MEVGAVANAKAAVELVIEGAFPMSGAIIAGDQVPSSPTPERNRYAWDALTGLKHHRYRRNRYARQGGWT